MNQTLLLMVTATAQGGIAKTGTKNSSLRFTRIHEIRQSLCWSYRRTHFQKRNAAWNSSWVLLVICVMSHAVMYVRCGFAVGRYLAVVFSLGSKPRLVYLVHMASSESTFGRVECESASSKIEFGLKWTSSDNA